MDKVIEWDSAEVKAQLETVKMFLTGLDGEDGAIGNITHEVLPDFGDDYELIHDEWNAFCPSRNEDFCTKEFYAKLISGDAEAIRALDVAARAFFQTVYAFAASAREKIAKYHEGENKRYYWTLECECYSAESSDTFATKKDCYDDMRNHALEKTKWNTEFDEDFEEGVPISYEFTFHPDEIKATSYSGTYVWKCKEK